MNVMVKSPKPLFETLVRFQKLTYRSSALRDELPDVSFYLRGFPEERFAVEGYVAARAFLKCFSHNQATFNAYRRHVECLLLWSLLIARTPLLKLNLSDGEDFLSFCADPPSSWVGPVVRDRFLRIGGRKAGLHDSFRFNPDWRPFNWHCPKGDRPTSFENSSLQSQFSRSGLSRASLTTCLSVCKSFFSYAEYEGLTEVNPFASERLANIRIRPSTGFGSRFLNEMHWEYVIAAAETMASIDPRHERTLFIVVTFFALFLNVGAIAGHGSDVPAMSDFQRDSDGIWWFHQRNRGSPARKICVRSEYVDTYLSRYRRYLNLSPLPSDNDPTPLLMTLNGRAGLSDRHIRLILQQVFDFAVQRMQRDGWEEAEVSELRSASISWIRNTSAKLAAQELPDFASLSAPVIYDVIRSASSKVRK